MKECENCGRLDPSVTDQRAPMTRYVKEELNRVGFLCDECYEEYVEYWEEMWKDYYRGAI